MCNSISEDGKFEGSLEEAIRYFYDQFCDADEERKRDKAIYAACVMGQLYAEDSSAQLASTPDSSTFPKTLVGNPANKYQAKCVSLNDRVVVFTKSRAITSALEHSYYLIVGLCSGDWTLLSVGLILTIHQAAAKIAEPDKCFLRTLFQNGFNSGLPFTVDMIRDAMVQTCATSLVCNQDYQSIDCSNYEVGNCKCDFYNSAKNLCELKILIPVSGETVPYGKLKVAE